MLYFKSQITWLRVKVFKSVISVQRRNVSYYRRNSVIKYSCDLLMLGSDVALYFNNVTRDDVTSLLVLLLLRSCDVTFRSDV